MGGSSLPKQQLAGKEYAVGEKNQEEFRRLRVRDSQVTSVVESTAGPKAGCCCRRVSVVGNSAAKQKHGYSNLYRPGSVQLFACSIDA